MKELKNKIALVTGASRGIGKGIAIALAKDGATVYITGRTEAVMKNKGHFDLSNSESPEFIGKVISKISSDRQAIKKTGKILVVAKEAKEYGILDIDGKRPRPLSVDEI